MHTQALKRFGLSLVSLILLQLFLVSVSFLVNPTNSLAASSQGAIATNFVIGSGTDSPFGINVSAAARYGLANQMQVPLGKARDTGAAWDREEFRWDMVYHRNTGTWDWGFTDEVVNKSANIGLNLLVLLDYNIDDSHTMPDLTAWSGYVRTVVSRYKSTVHYWEIWNEPENNTYLAGNSPSDYARLLVTSYNVIKSVDASAQVVTAGINGFAVPWLEQVMQQGGEDHFDVIGLHPYVDVQTSPFSPEGRNWVDDQLAYWTAFAARHGNKPLWATEFGWNSNLIGEEAQANFLARTYLEGLAAGLKKLFVYVFRDPADNARYGIVRSDWTTPKPAYNAYKTMVSQLSGATFQDRVDLFDNTRTSIDDLESGQSWWSYVNNVNANIAVSAEQTHAGSKALRLAYQFGPIDFASPSYAEFGKNGNGSSHISVPLAGQPTKVGFWVYGDNNSAILRILLTDANSQTLQYDVGKAGTKGWHRLEAYLPGPQAGKSGTTTLNYPLSFKSIQILRQPDPLETAFGGTLYLDDLYAEGGPNVQDYRFERKGKTLDVIWSDGSSGNVSVPTLVGVANLVNRDGQSSTLNTSNGLLNVGANDGMLYVEHQAPPLGTNNAPPPANSNCTPVGSNVQPNLNFSNPAFLALWNRYDLYAPGNRSYVWGDTPFAAGSEPYAQTSGGSRNVLYFDKSRMEITQPQNNSNAAGYVTNGLLTVELITGKLQTGDNQGDPAQFRSCLPAKIPVAGDNDDTNGPTYAGLAGHLQDGATTVGGAAISVTIDGNGNLGSNAGLANYDIKGGFYVPNTRHTIAAPFWDFLNNPNQKIYQNGGVVTGKLFDPWYVAPGLPITEAYWARVKVGGTVKDVLIQAFERRVLTYTPSNSSAFQVEWGNIGRHYFSWRYGD